MLSAPKISLLFIGLASTLFADEDPRAAPFLAALMAPDLAALAAIEVPALENIAIGTEGTREFLELRMIPDQKSVNGGNRAEVSVDFPFKPGQTIEYRWNMFLPEEMQSDAPQNRWWLVAQWHDQPDTNRGETWDGFPDRSPPIALYYAQIDGQDMLSVNYGSPDTHSVGLTKISRGVWHQFRAVIHWQTTQNGYANFFMDAAREPFATAHGANMHNDFGHYLKLGMYRHPRITAKAFIRLDNLVISRLPN